jgi:3-phytase
MLHGASFRPALPGGFLALALAACGGSEGRSPATGQAEAPPDTVVITEVFHTVRDTTLDIDSPAVWHGPGGQHWLLVTAKAGDVIRVHDATTGVHLRDVGEAGMGLGQFERPNGVAVVDDLLFVVERDNRRVQVLTLPDFRPLGTYGGTELVKPYGIAIQRRAPTKYVTWITDSYELVPDSVPPDSALGRRVREYDLTVTPARVTATLLRTFGDTLGVGRLKVVESIQADPANGRLLIAEELEGESQLKAYTLDGRFTGDTVPARFFPNQAEGIVLYTCADTAGYWVATDQGKVKNTFHVFDRMTLAHVASFHGAGVLNTDGIALTQVPMPGFPAGAFYAVHDDGNVAGFSWEAIAKATGLQANCLLAARGPEPAP